MRVGENVRGATCSWCRARPSPPTTTSWSCCSGSTRSAGERGLGHRGHPLLQLRQGRQEGRAPQVDPGWCAPTPSRPRAPTGWSPSTCTHRRCRASSASRSTTCTRCRCCATPSPPRTWATWWSWLPGRRLRQEGPRVGQPPAGTDRHRRQAPGRPHRVGRDRRADRLGRGRTALIVDDCNDLGRHAGRRRPGADRAGRHPVYAAVSHGPLAGDAPNASRPARSSGCS